MSELRNMAEAIVDSGIIPDNNIPKGDETSQAEFQQEAEGGLLMQPNNDPVANARVYGPSTQNPILVFGR